MEGFIFHKSYWDAISNLPDDLSKCNIVKAICEYTFYDTEPNLDGIEKSIWLLIKPNLDSSSKRYRASVENGKKGGRPKKTQEKPNNNLTKTQDNNQVKPNQNLYKDKDKDKDKDNVLSRLFEIFNSPDYAKNKIMKEWIVLDELEKNYALEKAEDYLMWEKSRGNAFFNLMYYLKDKKWGWDLTIQSKNHKIEKKKEILL